MEKVIHPGDVIPVPLVWDTTDNLETIYINHAAIVHNGPEYFLIFGELAMPIIKSDKDIPDAIHIKPKVRLAISPAQFKVIADLISKIANTDMEKPDDNA